MLNEAFEVLAENPDLGRIYDEVHEGLGMHPSGKHLVFYFNVDPGIDIVRILHERMDIQAYL